ncbi:MAG TPA: MFS transporter [Chloroflexota bacterium]|nr:MFS transporter [Chloroflexota bacterium]
MNRERPDSQAALIALTSAAFLVTLDRAIFAPLLPALATDLHGTISATGLAVTFYVIPYGLFQLLYGPLGDRIGKVAVVRWAVLLFAVGTGLCAAVTGLPMLYVLRAATGACAAAVIPMTLAYIGDSVPYNERQAAIATLMGIVSLGNVLSTAIGGIVGNFLSWRALFALYGVCSLAVTLLLFRAPRGVPAQHAGAARPRQRYRAVLEVGRARHLYLLVALEGVFVTGGFTYLGAFLRARFHLSYLLIGLILACYAGGTLLASRFVLRRQVLQFGEVHLVGFGGVCLAAGFLLLAPLPLWPLAPLLVVVMGAGFAFFHSTLQTRATELVPGLRGTSVALFAFSLFLGGGLGTAALGWLLTWGTYPLLLAVSGGGMLLVTLYARLVW